MSPVSAAATYGMMNAVARFEDASRRLVRGISGASDDEPAVAIADILAAKHQFIANVVVARTEDQMMGALLDLLA